MNKTFDIGDFQHSSARHSFDSNLLLDRLTMLLKTATL